MFCQVCGKLDAETRSTTDRFNEFSAEIVELLRSNIAPSPSRIPSISRTLLDAEADLKNYDSEVLRLQSRIQFINDKRRLLKQHIQKFKSLSAPIRKLPTEILAHIFRILCDSSYICIGRYVRRSTPFLLASICKWWREVAIEHSPLWSRMSLDLFGFRVSSKQDAETEISPIAAPVQLCLARSKVAPLTIFMHLDWAIPHKLINMLLEHADRWHDVTFFTLQSNVPDILTRPGGNLPSYPMLESLRFRGEPFANSLASFRNAAKLHHLAITQYPSDKDIQDVPWYQITSLDLESDEIGVLDTIELCPNLEFLSIQSPEPGGNLILDPPTVMHRVSHLTEMKVYLEGIALSAHLNMLQLLINRLTLPSLTKLTIASLRFEPDDPDSIFQGLWARDEFERFFQRSGCTITYLRLEKISIPYQDLQTLFKLTPSLVELVIEDLQRKVCDVSKVTECYNTTFKFQDIISPMFLKMLHVSNHRGALQGSLPLIPRLEKIELTADGDLFNDQAFLDMVTSRWTPSSEHAAALGVSCIQSVKVCVLGRKLKESVSSALRTLTRGGLRVVILSLRSGDDDSDVRDDISDTSDDNSSDDNDDDSDDDSDDNDDDSDNDSDDNDDDSDSSSD